MLHEIPNGLRSPHPQVKQIGNTLFSSTEHIYWETNSQTIDERTLPSSWPGNGTTKGLDLLSWMGIPYKEGNRSPFGESWSTDNASIGRRGLAAYRTSEISATQTAVEPPG